ncbi:MAG: aldolase/citrate lyase family protein [Oscillospiraceae bacterium]|nr:aldolase/citrate lyase family protein [Oscillospiraceae bacterium]
MAVYKPRPNGILELRRQGKTPLGLMHYTRNPDILEIAALAGFDFAMIDTEHCRTDTETLLYLIRTCDAAGLTPIIRVGENNPAQIRAGVECGARGIIVPHVLSPEEARRAVRACHYPPIGSCGICPSLRSSNYSQDTWEEYMQWANENISLVAMFEDVCAIDCAEAILDELTPGRDIVHMGLADIANSILKPGESVNWRHPYCAEASEKVLGLCKERGIDVMGMPFPKWDLEGANNAIAAGNTILVTFPDQHLFFDLCKEYVARMSALNE